MQRPPKFPVETHSHEGERGRNCEISSYRGYRDFLTTYITTELMSNSVQYAHWGEYKIEKVSLLRIDANLTSIAKNFLSGCVKV